MEWTPKKVMTGRKAVWTMANGGDKRRVNGGRVLTFSIRTVGTGPTDTARLFAMPLQDVDSTLMHMAVTANSRATMDAQQSALVSIEFPRLFACLTNGASIL